MTKNLFFVTLILLAIFLPFLAHKSEFEKYKQNFHKKYDNANIESYRQSIFNDNLNKINQHNKDPSRTYDQGLNQFADITQQEFQKNYLGLEIPGGVGVNDNEAENSPGEDVNPAKRGNLRNLQSSIDWRLSGVVTPVKNQGSCGSCWAFSTNGALQSLSIISDGTIRLFSEQQLVDCSTSYGNSGCNGGLMSNAFRYVVDQGIQYQSLYPYVAVDQTCKKNGGDFKISSYVNVASTSTALINALQIGPVSVAVDASAWSRYSSGVFSRCRKSLNHGVLLVGINNNNWVIKNSWGVSWGDKGYITLASGNTCGILNTYNCYPRI